LGGDHGRQESSIRITWEHDFITSHRVARLATVDAHGQPHVVPIVYAFDGSALYTPLDAKPKRVAVHQLQRVKNIQTNPHVAIVIDDYADDWAQLAWVQIRGTARLVVEGEAHATGVALLTAKYSQYRTMPLDDRPIIVITPVHITGWRAG
jgi:PPOX class probable F420-dependent enzyme